MGSVAVTVEGSASRVGLVLPDDVAVARLLAILVGHCEPQPQPWSRWALGPPVGEPFPPLGTLAGLGVMDGAELRLRDLAAGLLPLPDASGPDGDGAVMEGGEALRAVRRRDLTDLVERIVDDVGGIRRGRNPLLGYASPEARRRLRALAPGTFEQSPDVRLTDLGLLVRWTRDPRAPVAAVATATERPAATRPSPGTSLEPGVRRVLLHLLADPACRQLLDISVSGDPPARPVAVR